MQAENNQLLQLLMQYGEVRSYPAGATILKENSYIRAIPFVLKGSVRIIRTEEDDREILLYYLKAGESCVMSFLGGLHHEVSKLRAEVEEDAELLFLPLEKLTTLISANPFMLEYFFKLYHQRFEELLQVVNDMAFKKVDERLKDLLYKKRELTGKNELTTTHEQLANELGTARVVVSRLLKQLENQGVVRLGRNRIILL